MAPDKHESSTPATTDDARSGPPDPEAPGKPDGPTEMHKRSWLHAGRKVAREFSADQCTDLAAGLTYYAVLSLFPAVVAIISLLGVFGQGPKTTKALVDIIREVAPSAADRAGSFIDQMSSAQGSGIALIIGLLGALWTASGYVGAFGRAMNRIYGIGEGRPIWKLRPVQLVVTLVAVVLVALAAVILVISGPVATSVGNAIGLGSTIVTVWSIAKWPVLALIVVIIVALLYYATPNVKQPKFRWMSMGAFIAIAVWVVASAAFGFYISHFSNYNKTYGSLAGAIVFLLWVYITNIALLFGAEFDAETERARELQAGIAAEADIQLPLRDTRNIKKAEAKRDEDIERGRAIREDAESEQR